MTFTAMGALFSVGSCMACTFRGKNDTFNEGIGGALAGIFWGLKTRSIHTVLVSSVGGAFFGFLSSYAVQSLSDESHSVNKYREKFAYFSPVSEASK